MLLRSSSTPILGSLLSSFPDASNAFDGSSNNKHSGFEPKKKISFNANQQNFHGFLTCNTSPINHSHPIDGLNLDAQTKPRQTVRRAQSDGNLLGILGTEAHASDENADVGEDDDSNVFCLVDCVPTENNRRRSPKLEPVPSFSGFTNRNREDGEAREWDGEGETGFSTLEGATAFVDGIETIERGFSFDKLSEKNAMASPEQVEEERSVFLAKGTGHDVGAHVGTMIGGNGGNDFGHWCSRGGDDGDSEVDKYYQKMLAENPANPLFLRNYARYLHQTKKDYQRADEFFSRAILAEPGDGEILSQYAEFIWEVYRDSGRAENYHEQAVKASPDDSHVLAAYARFLWDTEENEDGEEDRTFNEFSQFSDYHGTSIASANASLW